MLGLQEKSRTQSRRYIKTYIFSGAEYGESLLLTRTKRDDIDLGSHMASAYGTAKGAFDGTRLVINTHMGRPSMDAKIWDAKRNPKYTKLSLTGALGVHGYQQQEPLSIDRDLAVAICELLHCDDRSWERIEFQHCTGQLDVIISFAMGRGRVQSLFFSEVVLELATLYALSTGLKFNTSLTEILFRRCIMTEAVTILEEGLKFTGTIQSMAMERCRLVDGKVAELVSALKSCESLPKKRETGLFPFPSRTK